MAFSGVLVTVFNAGGPGVNKGNQPLPTNPKFSQFFASGTSGITNKTAPANVSDYSVARVSSSKDIYVAAGAAPDASQVDGNTPQTARYLCRSGSDIDIYLAEGDKVAWADA